MPDCQIGDNLAAGRPWTPAPTGYAQTSPAGSAVTASVTIGQIRCQRRTDTGTDPATVVAITDQPDAALPGSDRFTTVRTAGKREARRGMSFTPGFCWR